jgi:hypothetical protein
MMNAKSDTLGLRGIEEWFAGNASLSLINQDGVQMMSVLRLSHSLERKSVASSQLAQIESHS